MITLSGGFEFTRYSFDTFGEALNRISKWTEKDLVSEEECADFIVQLFHQIPDELYNKIQNKVEGGK